MRRQEGFTLIEMLATLALAAILVALGATSLRNYWLTQSYFGARDQIRAQIRQLQAQVTSESHPLVYGIRFPSAASGSDTIGLIRYNPNGGGVGTATCTQYATATVSTGLFNGGAVVRFPDTTYETAPTTGYGFTVPNETTTCRGSLIGPGGGGVTSPPAAATDQYLWLYARGSATAGRVQIYSPGLARSLSLSVSSLTGRVSTS